MEVSLSPQLLQFLHDEVSAGHFSSLQEVIEAAVACLMLDANVGQADQVDWAAIDDAEAQLDRGEGIPLDETFARLRARRLGQ